MILPIQNDHFGKGNGRALHLHFRTPSCSWVWHCIEGRPRWWVWRQTTSPLPFHHPTWVEDMGMGQNPGTPVVHIKIAGLKWMWITPKNGIFIGIDPYPYHSFLNGHCSWSMHNIHSIFHHFWTNLSWCYCSRRCPMPWCGSVCGTCNNILFWHMCFRWIVRSEKNMVAQCSWCK